MRDEDKKNKNKVEKDHEESTFKPNGIRHDQVNKTHTHTEDVEH